MTRRTLQQTMLISLTVSAPDNGEDPEFDVLAESIQHSLLNTIANSEVPITLLHFAIAENADVIKCK